jgi:hypothetical protein
MPVNQDQLLLGESLSARQFLSSMNGRYNFVYQGDGNLVLYKIYRYQPWRPLWASNTAGSSVGSTDMQSDGNLVLYDSGGTPLWASNTAGNPGSRLVLQDDGNVVVYRPDNTPIWATNTAQPLTPSTINWPWAIILCRFNDVAALPHLPDYYVDLFTRNGAGGVCDYWRSVSFNALDLTGSRVFGWFMMNHSSAEVSRLSFPGARSTLVQWGKDAASANGVNLSGFKQVLVV